MTEKITGTIESVESTMGENEKGEWKRAGYKIAGKKYSTFDTKIIDAFKAGDYVNAEFEQKGEFKNITKMNAGDMKEEALGFGEQKSVAQEKLEKLNVKLPTPMYTSYAKDIFIKMMDDDKWNKDEYQADAMMKKAIDLVKQARKEFS